MVHPVITHTNTPHLPLLYSLYEGSPRSDPPIAAAIRRVQQVEVYISEPFRALLDGGLILERVSAMQRFAAV